MSSHHSRFTNDLEPTNIFLGTDNDKIDVEASSDNYALGISYEKEDATNNIASRSSIKM